MNITSAIDTHTCILFHIPEGKPDPKAPCTPHILANDTRPRVPKRPQQGYTCLLHAFNSIRERIGKNPSEELKTAREVEKRISTLCKSLLRDEKEIPPCIMAFFEAGAEECKTLNKAWAKQVLGGQKDQYIQAIEPKQCTIFLNHYVTGFSKQSQYEQLFDYLCHVWLQKRTGRYEQFLRDASQPLPALTGGTDLEKFSELEVKTGCIIADMYKLNKVQHQVVETFAAFMQQLKSAGPMAVAGSFGIGAYSCEPQKQKTSLDRYTVYAWPQGARNLESLCKIHTIIVVGAQKTETQECIYYMDPRDQDTDRKVYKISFQSFKDHILTLPSQHCLKEAGQVSGIMAWTSNRYPRKV